MTEREVTEAEFVSEDGYEFPPIPGGQPNGTEPSKQVALRPVYRDAAVVPDVVDGWVAHAQAIFLLADKIAWTDFVPDHLRGKPPAVAACILTGRELGLGPMAAMRHVQLVKGVPTLSAEYKRARVLAAGHGFQILERNTTRCRIQTRRRGQQNWTEFLFTMDDAKRADLIKSGARGPGAWLTRPRRMLFARCSTEACDSMFSDVTNGLPTTELVEEGEFDQFAGYDEPDVTTAEREKPRQTRKRNTPAKANPEPVPELAPEPPAAVQADEPGEVEPEVADPDPALEPVGQEMHKVIMSRFRYMRLDSDDEHGKRMQSIAAIIGRAVDHLDDVTEAEASTLADTLAHIIGDKSPQKARQALGVIVRQAGQPKPADGPPPPDEPLPDGEPE